MTEITIRAADGGSFSAYIANKQEVTGPGILLAHSMFGASEQARELADDLSLMGCVVVLPDLYWRLQPGFGLDLTIPENVPKAAAMLQKLDVNLAVEDLKATLAHMRRMKECIGKIGGIGRCLGGKLIYLMMTRSDIDCGASFYGVDIDKLLAEAPHLKRPWLNVIAGEDKYVPPAAQEKIRATFAGNTLVTIRVFEGRHHAFCDIGYPTYHAPDARKANELSARFLHQHLHLHMPSTLAARGNDE